jgi:hypothetical protein
MPITFNKQKCRRNPFLQKNKVWILLTQKFIEIRTNVPGIYPTYKVFLLGLSMLYLTGAGT